MSLRFSIEKKLKNKLGRGGLIETAHGTIETPALTVVGTKATVKAITPEQLKDIGVQAVLANTYHLYLQPGNDVVAKAGGFAKFMNWTGPTLTDSGGFQAFSLGAAFGTSVSKVAKKGSLEVQKDRSRSDIAHLDVRPDDGGTGAGEAAMAKISEDGVTFKSVIDGSTHTFTPERSMDIQHNLGADIMFAFDECTSPQAVYEYQKQAMDRTHRWAVRSLQHHEKKNEHDQSLFGIVQGGRFEDLRKESARYIAGLDFDGFGIGGSFDKEDMYTTVGWVNELLPEEKPRHLLGIGEPMDLFGGVENGADTFDCVAPTRLARHGSLYTEHGRINILNANYVSDLSPIDSSCSCYTCTHYTRSYLSHLFRSQEILGSVLASIHNIYFIVNLVKKIRRSIFDENFEHFKTDFLKKFYRQ
jgi:queuine tRNA-ribosyltransferase